MIGWKTALSMNFAMFDMTVRAALLFGNNKANLIDLNIIVK